MIDTNAFMLDRHIDKIVEIAVRNKKRITVKLSYNTYLKTVFNHKFVIKFANYLKNIISACEFIPYVNFAINVRGYTDKELDTLKDELPQEMIDISSFHLFNSYGRAENDKSLPPLRINDVFEAIKNYAPDDILIISNQGGIEKGFVDREMFEYKFDYISNALEDYTDISVSAYYCDSNNKRNANRKPNIGMIKEYMDFIEYMNNDEDEEEKIVYDTILMIGDASGKEGQFSDSDKKTAENFGCEYMDVDDFVDKYKG